MSDTQPSDDELVFLVRQRVQAAQDELEIRLRSKQERLIRRLLAENRQCGLEPGDLQVIALMSLANAIDSYDCQKAVFDAYYHFILERDLVNEMKRYNTCNHTVLNLAASLDEPLEEGGCLGDIIGRNDERLGAFDEGQLLELAEDASAGLSPIEKAVLAYRTLGYSYTEIGRLLKKSYRQISRIAAKIATRHQQRYE